MYCLESLQNNKVLLHPENTFLEIEKSELLHNFKFLKFMEKNKQNCKQYPKRCNLPHISKGQSLQTRWKHTDEELHTLKIQAQVISEKFRRITGHYQRLTSPDVEIRILWAEKNFGIITRENV